MKQMTRREDPLNFFELNGIDTGIQMTTPLKWPMTRGYTYPQPYTRVNLALIIALALILTLPCPNAGTPSTRGSALSHFQTSRRRRRRRCRRHHQVCLRIQQHYVGSSAPLPPPSPRKSMPTPTLTRWAKSGAGIRQSDVGGSATAARHGAVQRYHVRRPLRSVCRARRRGHRAGALPLPPLLMLHVPPTTSLGTLATHALSPHCSP